MHMRRVATPMLMTVGERDLKCPMPQREEFYAALRALGVPAAFYVSQGEGHVLRKAKDRADLRRRSVARFQRWCCDCCQGIESAAGRRPTRSRLARR
jgi:dipeptidyl aminopeptidase/acylaminoacyl peptidase